MAIPARLRSLIMLAIAQLLYHRQIALVTARRSSFQMAQMLLGKDGAQYWKNSAPAPVAKVSPDKAPIVRIAYSWSDDLTATCSNGITTTSGSQLPAPEKGGVVLYACVSDEAGNVTKGQAHFNWETTAPDVASVTWSQNGSIFTLSGYTDQDGSGLATNNTDTCTAAKYSTCSVTIYDRAGNSATATTPINDPGMGDVNVSFAGSVTESPLPPTAKITLETGQASITTWRYSWTNFQYDQANGKYICSGGNEINLATYSAGQPFQPPENIARGQAKLYSCVTEQSATISFSRLRIIGTIRQSPVQLPVPKS